MPSIPVEVYASAIAAVFVIVELFYKRLLRPVLGPESPTFKEIKPGLTAFVVLLVSFGVANGMEHYFLDYADSIDRYGTVFVVAMTAALGSSAIDTIKSRLETSFGAAEY